MTNTELGYALIIVQLTVVLAAVVILLVLNSVGEKINKLLAERDKGE